MFDSIDEPVGQQTEFLLKSIASRLSGRGDCQGINYTVIIDHNGVRMNPLIYVFPNRYKRQEADKIDIVSFIHQYKMKGTRLSEFVFGTYEYAVAYDGGRRKWRKVN